VVEMMQTLFVSAGHPGLALRVIDMFVFRGEKALFATALALMQANRLDILASSSIEEARSGLCLFSDSAQEMNDLMKMVAANCSVVSRKQIKRSRQVHRKTVASLLADAANKTDVTSFLHNPELSKVEQVERRYQKFCFSHAQARMILNNFHKRQRTILCRLQPSTTGNFERVVREAQTLV